MSGARSLGPGARVRTIAWRWAAAARLCLTVAMLVIFGGCPSGEIAHEHAAASATAGEVWTCPMHPAVRLGAPGACPICGMDLVAATGDGGVTVDPTQRSQLGIVLEPAVLRVLYTVTTIPGVVAWDTTRLTEVGARVDVRVDRVHVRVGQRVARGDRLFSVSGLELAATLAGARDGVDRAATDARLSAWGIAVGEDGAATVRAPAAGVVTELSVMSGATVASGMVLARIADPRAVTVEAWLPEGEPVPATARVVANERVVDARVIAAEPAVDAATRSRRIVLGVDGLDLPAGAYVVAELDGPGGEQVCVPTDAVVYTGPRRVVYVEDGARLVPRTVEVGVRDDGWVAITAGLAAGERVVTDGVFLIAADSRLRSVTP